MPLIAPSILSADFGHLAQQVQAVQQAGADWIHVDVMDGHFVPNLTIGPMIAKAARAATTLPIDVHLMIDQPDRYVPQFAQAGADYISIHAETCPHLHRSIALIHEHGAKAGVALNPATDLGAIEWVLTDLEFVLVMSVNPGFGGQRFIESSLTKITRLRRIIDQRQLPTLIQVDGGVNADTVSAIVDAGADVLVAGSAIYGSDDYRQAIADLKTPSQGSRP